MPVLIFFICIVSLAILLGSIPLVITYGGRTSLFPQEPVLISYTDDSSNFGFYRITFLNLDLNFTLRTDNFLDNAFNIDETIQLRLHRRRNADTIYTVKLTKTEKSVIMGSAGGYTYYDCVVYHTATGEGVSYGEISLCDKHFHYMYGKRNKLTLYVEEITIKS